MKLLTNYYLPFISMVGLFSIASCTVVEPRRTSYPPAVIKPAPTMSRPAVVTKPLPSAVINKPVIKTTVRSSVKAPKVKIRTYKPEQGDNPYDRVPTASTSSEAVSQGQGERVQQVPQTDTTSPAVKSLLIQAKGAMLLKRNGVAIEKLERALRIDARNPTIWHQLARAHFNQQEDATAISMAKKSNFYVVEGSVLEKQNWQLIKDASKRSEDIQSLKAAIQYERANP